MITIVIVAVLACLAFHAGHARYRHGRARGHRGIKLCWSSVRGPWVSVPARPVPGSATACNPALPRHAPSWPGWGRAAGGAR